MNRVTDWKRLKKLGLAKATVNLKLLEVAFDPAKAYQHLTAVDGVMKLLKAYGIQSTKDLEKRLQATDVEKPP